MKKQLLTIRVNGRTHELAVTPNTLLLDALRIGLGLTGTKPKCARRSAATCAAAPATSRCTRQSKLRCRPNAKVAQPRSKRNDMRRQPAGAMVIMAIAALTACGGRERIVKPAGEGPNLE